MERHSDRSQSTPKPRTELIGLRPRSEIPTPLTSPPPSIRFYLLGRIHQSTTAGDPRSPPPSSESRACRSRTGNHSGNCGSVNSSPDRGRRRIHRRRGERQGKGRKTQVGLTAKGEGGSYFGVDGAAGEDGCDRFGCGGKWDRRRIGGRGVGIEVAAAVGGFGLWPSDERGGERE